jgi:uncharacterized membrane protein YdjX (TVP38/TMEM64 family)
VFADTCTTLVPRCHPSLALAEPNAVPPCLRLLPDVSASPATSRPAIGRLLLIAAIATALVLGGRNAAAALPQFTRYIEGLGALGPVVFILGYAAATVAFIPGSVLTFAAGAIFGFGKGVVIVFVAATLGSTAAFVISRYVARTAIEKRVSGNVRFAAVDRAIAEQGRKIVFLLRLSPVFPFSLLNYALGLTRISLRDYVLASVGMLPGTILYVYYGKLAGDVVTLAGRAGPPRDTGYYIVLALGLVATVVVTTLVTRTARAALRAATDGAAG